MERNELEKTSRAVFDEIHNSQGEEPNILNRLASLLSTEYLKVDEDWFVGKICLDADCGSDANALSKIVTRVSNI